MYRTIRTGALVVFLAVAGIAGAQAQPSLQLKRVAETPKIDGDLSDAAWQDVEPIELRRWPSGDRLDEATSVRCATDGAWIFVAFDCKDAHVDPGTDSPRTHRQDVSLSGHDGVEFFLDPGTGGEKYVHLTVAPNGDQHDQLGTEEETDRNFNMHWRSAAKATPDGYAVEMAIPIEACRDLAGNEADTWAVNFCRSHFSPGGGRFWSAWVMTPATFHAPKSFGQLEDVPRDAKDLFLPVLAGVAAGVSSDATGTHIYPVKTSIVNQGGAAGTLHLLIDDVAPEGGRRQVQKDIGLGPKESLLDTVEMQSIIAIEGDPVVTAGLTDELGTWQSVMENLSGTVAAASKMDAYLHRSYYTTEPAALLHVSIDGSDASIRNTRLNASVVSEDNRDIFKREGIALDPGENRIELPLADTPAGTHRLMLDLMSAGGDFIERKALTLIKRPPLGRGNEVKTDRVNRCVLVDGEPFFPYGIVICGRSLHAIPKEGYNTVLRWWWGYATQGDPDADIIEAAKNEPLLQGGQQYGFKVIDRLMNTRRIHPTFSYTSESFVTSVQDWLKNDVAQVLPVIQHNPALLAVMGFDEPGHRQVFPGPRDAMDVTVEVIRTFREHGGYQPNFTNYNHFFPKELKYTQYDDVLSVYIYWHPEKRRGLAIREVVEKAQAFAASRHKPLWLMPMTENHGSGQYNPMTPREQFANTYIMMVNGAAGIYYFWWPNYHRDTVECFQQLSREVATLAPALMRRAPKQEITLAGDAQKQSAVDFALRVMPDGTPVIALVNVADYAVDFTCDMPWLSEGATVRALVPRGEAALTDGVLAEKLEPLATRAYRIDGHLVSDLDTMHAVTISEAHPPEAAAHHAGPVNLVPNPGFEERGEWNFPDGAEGNVTITPETSASGQRSLKISVAEAGESYTVTSPVLRLKPHHSYQLKGNWKVEVKQKPERYNHNGLVVRLYQKSGPKLDWLPAMGNTITHDQWEETAIGKRLQTGDAPVEVEFSIGVYPGAVGEFWVDDVALIDEGPIAHSDSRNVVPNGSFEVSRLRGWPDRWQVERYDPWENNEVFFGDPDSPFRLDDRDPVHGEVSLRYDSAMGWAIQSAPHRRVGDGIKMTDGREVVFSIYLRASRAGMPVTVSLRAVGEATFEVGTSWKRYHLTGTYDSSRSGGTPGFTGIEIDTPDNAGVLWLDAVQLEEGAEPSEYVPYGYVPEYPVFDD